VQRTPQLLPVLAEAGVVDAGGLGLLFLLEGMLRGLRGESLEAAAGVSGAVGRDWLALTEQRHATEESLYGYCTELLISGEGLDPDAIRGRMLELGDSVLVVGDERLVRVHVHTDDPGAALSHGTSVGSLAQVKVDNIRRQAEEFVRMHSERAPAPPPPEAAGAVSTVAVVAGEGMRRVFESVGCTRTVAGGPTMNPSTEEILAAVESCPGDEVIILPNDKNVVMAAQQAAGLAAKRCQVMPTRSMPQGLAALLAMNPEEGADQNLPEMQAAAQAVHTIEVTRAVRSTSIGGVRVEEGDVIAIVDDELRLTAATPEDAVEEAVAGAAGGGTSLITLYWGAGSDEQSAAALAERLRGRFPDHEVEVVFGGQPHYHYIVSVE
jgi:DAK2 domain fusion protein YloV